MSRELECNVTTFLCKGTCSLWEDEHITSNPNEDVVQQKMVMKKMHFVPTRRTLCRPTTKREATVTGPSLNLKPSLEKLSMQKKITSKHNLIKMKFFAVLAAVALVGGVSGQKYTSTQNNNEIVIVRSENENNGDGTFRWVSELSDGTKLEQSGYVKDGPDPENPIQVIQGAYSYVSPEGEQIQLSYTADENGFVPTADHLPTPPPVPEAIQKAIDLILRNADNAPASSNVAKQYRRPLTPPSRRF